MRAGRRSTWLVIAALVPALAWLSGCDPRDDTAELQSLQTGHRWTLSFPAGESRELPLPLREDWYLDLAVHQEGMDVFSRLIDPDGRVLVEVDTTSGELGIEEIVVVSESSGTHRLLLEAASQSTDGRVEVELRAAHPATPEDRHRASAMTALARGRLAWIADDLPATRRALHEALPALAELGDLRRETEARQLLGRALGQQEKWAPAAEELRRAQEGYRELGETADEALVSNRLGYALRHLGRPVAAEAAYRRALSLARRVSAGFVEAAALYNLAILARERGEIEEALDLSEQALAVRRTVGPPRETARVLRQLASLYTLIGRDEDALARLEEASRLSDPGTPAERAQALDALAWARHWAGDSAQALSDYDTALELARESGDEPLEVRLLARRTTVLRTLGHLDQAREDIQRVLRRRVSTGDRSGEGAAWTILGWIELESGNLEPARKALERAAEILTENERGEDRFITYLGLGKVARRTERWQEGRKYLEEAIATVEEMRFRLTSRLSRGYLLGVRYETYEELIGLLMDHHRREPDAGFDRQALEVAERARARGLLEDLTSREPNTRDGDETAALRRIRRLELERMELQRHHRDSPRLERLDEELRRLWQEAERTPQLAATRRVTPHHLKVPEMQALLDEDTRLVVFSLGEPESHVWVLSRDSVRPFPLPGRRMLSELARETAAAMAQSRELYAGRVSDRRARQLSDALLAPMAEALDAERLVIVPDGALHLVPLAALPDPRSPDSLLIDRHEIVVVGSPSVLALQREKGESQEASHEGSQAPLRVAVLADPVYEADDPRLDGPSDSPTVAPVELPTDLQRSVEGLDLARLERLHHTGSEARAILARLPRGHGFLFEGFAARREMVIGGGLSGYPIVHLAAHGLVHPVHPELSGIVLSLLDKEGRARDGFLRSYEVARLDLPARLVVLSACRTALGHEIRGETPLGLVQAFFRAGSRRILASNWKVDDYATAELMDRFFAELLEEGRPPGAALREAQLSLRLSERWNEPYYWAAFQLHGDWRGSFSQQTRD